jgi:hypothetical protein
MEAVSASAAELRRGDHVEVLSAAEIMATLDERGELDAVPFMPEMVDMCGRRFTVAARAERICDTVTGAWGARTMADTVLLEGASCSGSAHGGCAAACVLYWKEAWLRRVSGPTTDEVAADDEAGAALLALALEHTTTGQGDALRYSCQATQAIDASAALSAKDPGAYLRAYRSGNVGIGRFLRVMARAVVMQSAKKLGVLSDPPVRGATGSSTRMPMLDLQPGEWVRVKSREEIRATLNDKGKNRGLWFDREMLEFCGQVFQVRHRVDRLIDERTGQMIDLKSDCVALDGATCSGVHSLGRWFCPRAIYPYWREGWLERVETSADVSLPTVRVGRKPTPV